MIIKIFNLWVKSFVIVLFLLSTVAHAKDVYFDNDVEHIDLLNKITWLKAHKNVQLSDVQNLQTWQQNTIPNKLKKHESLWGTVDLYRAVSSDEPFVFKIGNPMLDYVDVYLLDDKNRILSSYLMGAKREFDKRPFQHRLFMVPIDPRQPVVKVFFKVRDDGPIVFPVTLARQSALIANEELLLLATGVVCGALALLGCYFFATYILLRSPIRYWFAVSNGTFLLLFLNIKGVLGQFTGFTAYISNISAALFGVLLITIAKVTFSILEIVPTIWRHSFYALGFVTVAMAFSADTNSQIIFAVLMSALSCLIILIIAFIYNESDKRLANLVCLGGISLIAISGFTRISLYLATVPTFESISLIFTTVNILGMILIALSIEGHERVVTKRHHLKQESAITDLHRYYSLFQNSAEGLYASNVDGTLILVNPAMCQLFGYETPKDLLENIENAEQFYSDHNDRELMIGEIHKNGKVIGKEVKGIRKDGSEFWFSISGQIKEDKETRYVFGSMFDVTERKQSNLSLEYQASHDSLTGIYNRREFDARLQKALHNAKVDRVDLALLYLDLDQVKVVNDTCGHKAGDLLIKELSLKLDAEVSGKGMLARVGGDEFAVLLEGDEAPMAYLLANKLLNLVQEFRFTWENRVFTLGLNIGHAPWQANIGTPEQLMSMADAACYLAQEKGSNQIHTYSSDDQQMHRYEAELSWVSKIHHALENALFSLHYQHYLPLSKKSSGHQYELLLRMQSADKEVIFPEEFLPAAERYNLTAKIDRWVIEYYFGWLTQNPEHLNELTQVSININGYSLGDKELKLFILNAFEKHNIPYQKVCFEISEGMAIGKMEETLDFMNTFQKLGCAFALDSFGSGIASYNYLKNLPVSQVKIDGSLVKNILVDPIDLAMVSSIHEITKAMGMETVAKFVESSEVMVALGKAGIDYAQGYGIAKPVSLLEFQTHS
ncbi:EAL domain-containing protein [Paraglaciecola sp. 2405UD69-4]|uniref:EAL domain-containing protein n=1 Tax=Paraglaciecola sp. 2405UD69-4 TaxID=3391836 RepID=UPI0039C9D6C5